MLPVFNGFMRPIFYTNISKLVVAVEHLLSRELKKSNLEYIKNILKLFVEVEKIYPSNIMLSGMHELLHLADCSRKFGPLNLINCFQFEEVNRKIVRLIFGKDLIGDEFLYNFSILQALSSFCNTISNFSKLTDFIEKQQVIKTSNKKKINKNMDIIFGPLSNLKKDQITLINSICTIDLMNVKVCLRLNYNGILYTNANHSSKRGDFCIKVNDVYGLIEFFLVNQVSVFVLVRKVSNLSSPIYVPEVPMIKSKLFLCHLTDEYFLTQLKHIEKAFFIKVTDDLSFISTFSTSHLFL